MNNLVPDPAPYEEPEQIVQEAEVPKDESVFGGRPWLIVAILAAGAFFGGDYAADGKYADWALLVSVGAVLLLLGMCVYRTPVGCYSVYRFDSPFRSSLPADTPIALDGENGLQPEFDTHGWTLHWPFFRQRKLCPIPEAKGGTRVFLYLPFGKDPDFPNVSGKDVPWTSLFGSSIDWKKVREELKKATRGKQRHYMFGGGVITSLPPYVMAITESRVFYYDEAAPEYRTVTEAGGKPNLEMFGLKPDDFAPTTVVPKEDEVSILDGDGKETGRKRKVIVRKALALTMKDGEQWTGETLEESGLFLKIEKARPAVPSSDASQSAESPNPSPVPAAGLAEPAHGPDPDDAKVLEQLIAAPAAPFGDVDLCLEGWNPKAKAKSDGGEAKTGNGETKGLTVKRGPLARLAQEGSHNFNPFYIDAKLVDLPIVETNEIGVIQSLIGPVDHSPYADGTTHVGYRGVWAQYIDRGVPFPFNDACFQLYKLFAGIVELTWEDANEGTFALSKGWVKFRVSTAEGFESEQEGIDAVPFVHFRISRKSAAYVVLRYGEGARSGQEILRNVANRLKPVVEEVFRAWVADKKVQEDLLNQATEMRKQFFRELQRVLRGEYALPGKDPEDYGVTLVQAGVRFVNLPDTYMSILRDRTYATAQVSVFGEQRKAQEELKKLNEAKVAASMALTSKRVELYEKVNEAIGKVMKDRGTQIKALLSDTGMPSDNEHVITFLRQLVLDDSMFLQVGQDGVPLSRIVGMISGNTASQPIVSQFLSGGDGKGDTLLAVLRDSLERVRGAITASQQAEASEPDAAGARQKHGRSGAPKAAPRTREPEPEQPAPEGGGAPGGPAEKKPPKE